VLALAGEAQALRHPYLVTMRRAISLARSRSLCAPVETSPYNEFPATRLPGAPQSDRRARCESSGSALPSELIVIPSAAMPRGMIVHLVNRVGVRDGRGDQRVTLFVVRHDVALLLRKDWLFFSSPATTRSIASSKSHLDRVLLLARREQRPLVDDVREIRAGEAGRAGRDHARSMPDARTTARACSLRMASRPLRSGLSTTT